MGLAWKQGESTPKAGQTRCMPATHQKAEKGVIFPDGEGGQGKFAALLRVLP